MKCDHGQRRITVKFCRSYGNSPQWDYCMCVSARTHDAMVARCSAAFHNSDSSRNCREASDRALKLLVAVNRFDLLWPFISV
jgi:hypothetical protein